MSSNLHNLSTLEISGKQLYVYTVVWNFRDNQYTLSSAAI
jgi:hypothetical protein